jgi:asparagine synthase (glutamine-hydrolysing)
MLFRLVDVPEHGWPRILGHRETLGHHCAFHDVYGLMAASRFVFFNDETLAALDDHNPYLELAPDRAAMGRWHSLNQSAWWASRIHLPGHLLSLKGDRPAMHSSVETRYPFLDEDVFALLAALHPRWKLRGFRDKYLLRLLAGRYLPPEIAWRRKFMFRAPMESFFRAGDHQPAWVQQLLSDEALATTGWFRTTAVRYWQERIRAGTLRPPHRAMVQLGMVGVLSSQLWYHTFIGDLVEQGLAPGDTDAAGSCTRGPSCRRGPDPPAPAEVLMNYERPDGRATFRGFAHSRAPALGTLGY